MHFDVNAECSILFIKWSLWRWLKLSRTFQLSRIHTHTPTLDWLTSVDGGGQCAYQPAAPLCPKWSSLYLSSGISLKSVWRCSNKNSCWPDRLVQKKYSSFFLSLSSTYVSQPDRFISKVALRVNSCLMLSVPGASLCVCVQCVRAFLSFVHRLTTDHWLARRLPSSFLSSFIHHQVLLNAKARWHLNSNWLACTLFAQTPITDCPLSRLAF